MEFDINWNLCLICQATTSEELHCPFKVNAELAKTSYASFLYRISMLIQHEVKELPKHLASGISVSLLEINKAQYHNSCYVKFNKSQVEPKMQQHQLTLSLRRKVQEAKLTSLSAFFVMKAQQKTMTCAMYRHSALMSVYNKCPKKWRMLL